MGKRSCCAGIKAVKLYAWEAPFERRINHLRWLELEQIRHEPRVLKPFTCAINAHVKCIASHHTA
jgi:hypothetical protein